MAIIGIDLGTSNSAAAMLRGGRPVIIPARAESLKRVLQEAGSTLYAEGARPGPTPRPEVETASGEARPSGAGPRGRVIDAEYRESRP